MRVSFCHIAIFSQMRFIIPTEYWIDSNCFDAATAVWTLSLPCHIESASEERAGDPGQPDGPHAGMLQEELRQPVGC